MKFNARLSSKSTHSDILNHPDARFVYVVKNGPEGNKPNLVARIAVVYPRDNMGTLYAAVYDFTTNTATVGNASGCGHDKLTAALAGQRVGGIELGNHCDPAGRPRLQEVCSWNKWLLLDD